MSVTDGFVVVDAPRGRSKYMGLFDMALNCDDGKCIAKVFDTGEEARRFTSNVKTRLANYKKNDRKLEPLHVSKSGRTVYVYKEVS